MIKKNNLNSSLFKYYNIKSLNNYKFILLFYLNKKTILFFNSFINKLIKLKFNLIIVIDKNSFKFNDLIFLKDYILLFYKLDLKLGIWGLPDCVMRLIFADGFDFIRLEPYLIKTNYLFYEINNSLFNYSVQLVNCNDCFIKNNCVGLGLLNYNSKFFYRKSIENRLKEKKKVSFDDNIINLIYSNFISHIASSSLYYTDRTLRYVKSYTKIKKLKYSNRFVYFSRYIHKSEFNFEFEFLLNNILNFNFLKNFYENFYLRLLMRSFAYSIAKLNDNFYRESFYFYFIEENQIINFLKLNYISFTKNDFEEFKYISYDLKTEIINKINFKKEFDINDLEIESQIFGFKLYSKIFNIDAFFNFLKTELNFIFPEELMKISFNYYLVRRYDKNFNLIGFKFEFNSKDSEKTKLLLENLFGFIIPREEELKMEIFAIDLSLDGFIKKISIYYGNF